MLFSAENVRIVAGFLQNEKRPPLVVDRMMVSTQRRRFAETGGNQNCEEKKLLPLATLVNTKPTTKPKSWPDSNLCRLKTCALPPAKSTLAFGCAALVKSGHLRGGREAVDIFFDGRTEIAVERAVSSKASAPTAPVAPVRPAIAGYLARGCSLPPGGETRGNNSSPGAIAGSYRIGKHSALNQLFR